MLVYDDGSTDETPRILERISKRDPRFRVMGHTPLGIVGALSTLADAADAPFIGRMDADDISHRARLADTLALLEADPDLALGSVQVAGFPKGRLGPGMARYIDWLNSRVTPDEIADDMFVESPLCHPAVVMRKEMFEAVGGYIDDGGPEDYGLWLRLHRHGCRMAKIRRCRFFWRDSDMRLTRCDPRYDKPRFLKTKVNTLAELHLNSAPPIVIWGAGKLGRQLSRILDKKGHPPRAFIDVDPKKVGHRVHGAIVQGVPENRTEIRGRFILVAVGAWGIREKIRTHLIGLGLKERSHFVCVA